HFVIPDWVGFRVGDPYLYLYLGVPALFGAAWLIKKPDRAVLAVLAACALFMTNPGDIISGVVSRSALLVQVFPMLSFIEPATLVFGFLAANGIDAFLQSKSAKPCRRELAIATAALLVIWSVYRLSVWPR